MRSPCRSSCRPSTSPTIDARRPVRVRSARAGRGAAAAHVHFAPIATRPVRRDSPPLCAKRGCKQVQQPGACSITSSARASSVGGTSISIRRDKELEASQAPSRMIPNRIRLIHRSSEFPKAEAKLLRIWGFCDTSSSQPIGTKCTGRDHTTAILDQLGVHR